MAITSETTTVFTYECDGCGRSTIGTEDAPRPLGFYLDVGHTHGGGGDFREDIYACRETCIRRAVVNAFQKEV